MQDLFGALFWRGTMIALIVVVTIACTLLARVIGGWLRVRRAQRPDTAAAFAEGRDPGHRSARDGPTLRRALPRSAHLHDSTRNGESREAA